MKNIRNGLKGFLEDSLQKGKEVAQTAAAGAEQYATTQGVGKLFRGAVQKGKEARAYVQERGSLAQIAQETVENLADTAENLIKRVDEKYANFESQFFSGGEINQENLNKALENAAVLTELYGRQAVERLRTIASQGVSAAKVSYRDFAPNKEERRTTYAGIGSKIPFYILTRADGDKCLNFHEEMRNGIQGRPAYKGQVLADIKSYVITDRKELINFYKEAGNSEMVGIAKKL